MDIQQSVHKSYRQKAVLSVNVRTRQFEADWQLIY